MKEYTVKVFENRTVWYNKKDQLHREDDPAVEWAVPEPRSTPIYMIYIVDLALKKVEK